MAEKIDDFISHPSEELLEQFTKDQLLKLASNYDIEVTSSERRLKDSVKEALKAILVDSGVLKAKVETQISQPSPLPDATMELKFRELALKEKQLLLEEKRMLLEHDRALKELELGRSLDRAPSHSGFDVGRHIKMVPPFVEKDVEKVFSSL